MREREEIPSDQGKKRGRIARVIATFRNPESRLNQILDGVDEGVLQPYQEKGVKADHDAPFVQKVLSHILRESPAFNRQDSHEEDNK